ncbi:MAG: 50S ribosomal protein L11 methyltransferase, partial [Hyphomicrobiales bacterium]|nr:50S ribosomal protein L11 methyltransferase [Hyphomicrobiales bacterium]
ERADWVARSLEGLAPVRAGRFLVHGGHDRDRVAANDVAVEIEAGLAFGTGHHGTTRGCLLLLDDELKRRRLRRILDVGTGAGTLAIAAARRLKIPVAAGDLDPVAVATAADNARLNGVATLVRPVVARGARHGALRAGAPYDAILANILAKPLRGLAPELASLLGRRGALFLSGLLARDVPGVLDAYRAQGLYLTRRIDLDGWAALRLTRGGR